MLQNEDPKDPEGLTLGGYLTVVGQDDKPGRSVPETSA